MPPNTRTSSKRVKWLLPRTESIRLNVVRQALMFEKTHARKSDADKDWPKHLRRRDLILEQLKAVHIASKEFEADHPGGQWLTKPGTFTQADMLHLNLYEATIEFVRLTNFVEQTVEDYPREPKQQQSIVDEAFSKTAISHIVVWRIKDPNETGDRPLVYATANKQDQVVLRTWSGLVKPEHCALYKLLTGVSIRSAAAQKQNEILVSISSCLCSYLQC